MPSSQITRAQAFTFGGVKVGTGTDYALTDVHVFEDSYEEIRVTYTVLVQDDTTSSFVTECLALVAAMRTPNSDLKIEYGGSTLINFTQAADTILNARGSIEVVPGATSNNSILYLCSVVGARPADEAGKNGRQSASYRIVSDEAGIDSLEVSARYTAVGGTSALSLAQTNFATYAATLQPSGDWDEATTLSFSPDDENKFCDAFTSYQELIHNQNASAANDAAFVGEQITVTTNRSSPQGDRGANAKALVQVTVAFSTAVLHTNSTDLQSKWEGIRSYLVSVAETQSGVSGLTVINENPAPDPTGNRLSGTIVLLGADGSSLLHSETLVSKTETSGKIYTPIANGDKFAVDTHQGPAIKRVVIQSTIYELDSIGAGRASGFGVFDTAKRQFEADGYEVEIEDEPLDRSFEHLGHGFTSALRLRVRQKKVTMRFVSKASGGPQRLRTRTR